MAQHRDRLFVAAIELGSTYSGYGWSSKMDFPHTPLKIHHTRWAAGSMSLATDNTPTTLLLNPDKSFRSFGYEAQNEYSTLCADGENYQDYFYFHRFNDTLNKNMEVRTMTMLEATNSGKMLPAQHIYAHAIRYLRDNLFKSLKDSIQDVRICDILFVLVVPSDWDDGALQFIQEAANNADIPTDQQLIVSECEAALAYYHFFLESKVADQKDVHKPGRRSLIVDIGGGTLKLSVVKKNQTDGYIKESDRTICKTENGTFVDETFLFLLDEVIGNGTLEKLREESFQSYIGLFREFETNKISITTEKRGKITLSLPTELLDIIKKQKDNFSERIKASKYSDCVKLKGGKLQIDVENFREFFTPTIDRILKTIDGILYGGEFPSVEHIFVHGGFTECKLLLQAMLYKHERLILIPEHPELVVIEGAVLRGHTLEKTYIMPGSNVVTSPGDVSGKSSTTLVESHNLIYVTQEKNVETLTECKALNNSKQQPNVKTSPGDAREQSSSTAVESRASNLSTLIEKKKYFTDNSPLFKVLRRRDKDETERLLNANMDPLLPDENGKTPFHIALETEQLDIVKLISSVICKQFKSYIQSRYGNLLYKTWMGYKLEQGFVDLKETFQNICIVGIYTKQPPCTLCKYFRHIPIRWRQKEEVSDEGQMTSQFENVNVNFENKIPPKLAETLFNEHSNLTILHPSSVKSTNFSTQANRIVEKRCIALYCHIKGIIPLGEKQFHETVRAFGLYEIDVREGYCTVNMGDLRPGTAIYCPNFNSRGTTGGFVEDTNGDTAFITAAHVVTNCRLRRFDENDQKQFLQRNNIQVRTESNEIIGSVERWCFKSGNYNETSVDAAIVRTDKRNLSTDSMFPATNQEQWDQAGYSSSNLPRMCTREFMTIGEIISERRSDVIKYGMSSQITIGNIIYDGAYIRLHDEEVHYEDADSSGNVYHSEDVVMYYQMGVQGRGGKLFSQKGDSGAFCCMVSNDNQKEVRSFGMIIAGSSSGVSFVTPLENVFQELELDFSKGIKFFPQNAQTQGPQTNQPMPSPAETLILQGLQQIFSEQQKIRETLQIQDQKIDDLAKDKKS